MWLSRPVYESLPYVYVAIGLILLIASFFVTEGSTKWLVIGMILLIGGLVLWLKRRDYRIAKSEYDGSGLDE
jgi:hypothetical protein